MTRDPFENELKKAYSAIAEIPDQPPVVIEDVSLNFISWKELREKEFEDPKWVVENLIPEKGLVALSGSPESGKSWFSEYIAIQVATGQPLLGKFSTTKTGVLIIDQENLLAWLNKRFTQLSKTKDLDIYFFQKEGSFFSFENESSVKQTLDFIEEKEIGLVIIDTLRLTHDKDENSSKDMKFVVNRLKQLQEKSAVLFLHHHRKTNPLQKSVSGEDMMGSITIRGAVDYQLTLIKKEDVSEGVTRINVSQSKARYTKPIKPFEITLEEISTTSMDLVYQGEVEPEKQTKDEAKDYILTMLGETQSTKKELIDGLLESGVCKVRTAERALSELIKSGKISATNTNPQSYNLMNFGDSASRLTNNIRRNGEHEEANND